MEKITLSIKECLLAAAKSGAKQFFGLSNPFVGMTADAVRQEIGEIQLSMEKKGYAEVGFDDVFSLREDVNELIGLCTNCDSYLLAQFIVPNEQKRQLVVYAGAEDFAHAQVYDDTVTLGRLKEDTILRMLLDEIRPAAAGVGDPYSTQIRQGDLAKVQSLATDDPSTAIDQLAELGFPLLIATLLVQGFRKEAVRCAFFHTDLKHRTLTQLIALQSESGAVCMTLENADEDIWNARFLPGGITEEVLEPLCPRKGGTYEVS